MDTIKIGNFLAELRKEHGFTQETLGEKLGVTNKTISRWENGVTMPDVSLFVPLCDALGITLDEFFSGERQAQTPQAQVSAARLPDFPEPGR